MLDSIKPKSQPRSPENRFPKTRRFRFRLIVALVMLVLLAAGIFVGSKLVIFAQKILEGSGAEFSFKRLFLARDKQLIGEEQGEIRVLLMGIGGPDHEGGTLTDTIILATLRLKKFKDDEHRIGLVSIPRDLVVNIPGGFAFRKINNAYAFGGPALAVQTVERFLDLTIPYYAVIDFQGFKKIIDDLGGVEINVEAAFTDSLFPDAKLGYLPPLTFERGLQKMDGERALQYIRSRHGDNNQGTDFARSRRQQQLLQAVQKKIRRLNILTNLNLLSRTLENLADHIRTNLAPHEIKHLYDLAKALPAEDIHALAIDVESGVVCNQVVEETGAYVLLPCQGLNNYQAIRDLIKNQFLVASIEKEKALIEIQGTAGAGLLVLQAKEILSLPFLQVSIGNFRSGASYDEGVIYDNTRGTKPRTLNYIQEKLGMRLAQSPFPFPTTTDQPDFVIVVVKK